MLINLNKPQPWLCALEIQKQIFKICSTSSVLTLIMNVSECQTQKMIKPSITCNSDKLSGFAATRGPCSELPDVLQGHKMQQKQRSDSSQPHTPRLLIPMYLAAANKSYFYFCSSEFVQRWMKRSCVGWKTLKWRTFLPLMNNQSLGIHVDLATQTFTWWCSINLFKQNFISTTDYHRSLLKLESNFRDSDAICNGFIKLYI